MDNPQYVLNEINKGIKMGMDSISTISEKVEDNNFKNDLLFQYDKYNEILNRVNSELKNYDDFPKELPPMQKTMGYIDIQLSTLNDKSNSHIAEMLIQGNTMGIVECQKLINHNPDAEDKVKNVLHEFMSFSQNNIEKMKEYL